MTEFNQLPQFFEPRFFGGPMSTMHMVDVSGPPLNDIAQRRSFEKTVTYYRPCDDILYTSFMAGAGIIGKTILPYLQVTGAEQVIYSPNIWVYRQATNLLPWLAYAPQVGQKWWNSRYDGMDSVIKKVKPSLNSGFSLINFLIQYKDIIHIYTHWLSQKGRVKRLHEIMQQLYHSPSSAIRTAANEWLELQYGTLQFFRDAFTIWNILRDWEDKAKRFLEGANQWRSITTNNVGNAQTSVLLDSATVPFPMVESSGALDTAFRLETYAEGESRCTLVYSYTVPEMRGFLARLAQLSDSFGVGLDPSIIWDAIPFTFVVDWFFNVGEWLHNQRHDWVNAEVTYHQYGNSAKQTISRYLYWIRPTGPDGAFDPLAQDLIFNDSYRIHTRELKELPPWALPRPENNNHWSITRLTNATALLVQKAVKGHRIPPHKPVI
jgi:hypothetical protein